MITGRGWKLTGALVAISVVAQLSIVKTTHAQFTKCVTKFEDSEGLVLGDEVLLQEPRFSGSTTGIVINETAGGIHHDYSQVVGWFPSPSDRTYEVAIPWASASDNAIPTSGVRLTTLAALHLPRPSVHLGGKIRFKMAVYAFAYESDPENPIGAQYKSSDRSILLTLAIRETGTDLPQGAEDAGGGDLEYVYLTGSEVKPDADSNGLIAFPPGGKRFAATTLDWPTGAYPSGWYDVEFDLGAVTSNSLRGFANNGDGTDTAGDGFLDATLNPNGDGVNRGSLESIIITNDPNDTVADYFFVYFDDFEFVAPDPDPFILAPTVIPPLFDGDTTVVVNTDFDACAGTDVSSVGLYIDGALVDDTPTSLSNGQATFSGLIALNAGEVVTARQARGTVKSSFSAPVTVFDVGVVFADDFDSYTSQEDLNQVWSNSINFPTPADARVNLVQGGAASCENMVREFNANVAGLDGARAYRFIGDVNGTDAEPLRVTWNYQHRGASSFGARFRFELARFANGTFSAAFGARLPGTTGIILENGPGTVPIPQTLNEYNILLVGAQDVPEIGPPTDTNGFFDGNQTAGTAGEVANTGINRGDNAWHKMQVEVKSDTINYYIDDALANPVDTNGLPLWPDGVPRPNTDPYNFIVIGQGFSNNGPEMLIDNIQVTQGSVTLPFGPPVATAPPTVSGSYLPGDTVVTIVDVSSNATEVELVINSATEATTNGAGGVFLDNTAKFTVAGLDADDVIQATQTTNGVQSCLSSPVIVTVPVPTVVGPLVPGQTVVSVSDLNEGDASAVAVYRDEGGGSLVLLGSTPSPATDPVNVTVTSLMDGWSVVATQTLGGAESAASAAVVVGVPTVTVEGPLLPGDATVTVSGVHPDADLIEVFADGNSNGSLDVSASSADSVSVAVSPSLAAGSLIRARQTIGGVTGAQSAAVEVSVPMCLVVFDDDFETNTASNWNVNVRDDAATDDASATFAWDYETLAGVPKAPNSADSDSTLGLRFDCNNGGLPASAAAVTTSPVGLSFMSSNGYRLLFDGWINANGDFPGGGPGSTQAITLGVGYNDATANHWTSVGGTVAGDGAWFAITGEGGSTRDVQAFKDVQQQFPESGQFAGGNVDGTANNTNASTFFADLFGSATIPAAQTALYPATQFGDPRLGDAGFAWHRMEVTAFESKARWSINGTTVVTINGEIGNPVDLDGNVSLGHMDPYNSEAGEPAMNFGLADNVLVLTPHTPGTNGDYDNDGDVDDVDTAYFVDCLGGPAATPSPRTGFVCSSVCIQVFDFDDDEDVDLDDYKSFQSFYNP